jgi:hypothetical protein
MRKIPTWQKFIKKYVRLINGLRMWDHINSFQLQDFEGIFTHRFSMLNRPRGNSKTFDLSVSCANDLVMSETQQRIYVIANDQEQAELIVTDVARILMDHDDLSGLARITKTEIQLKDHPKSFLKALPSDAPGSLGLRPTRLLCDEMGSWPPRADALFFSLYNALIKTSDSRMVIISTPSWDLSGLLHRILEEARHDPRWYVSERGPEANWISEEDRNLFRHDFMDQEVWLRDYEGVWTQGHGALFPEKLVDGVGCHDMPEIASSARCAIGVDIGYRHNWSVLVVVKRDPVTDLLVVEGMSCFDPKKSGGSVSLNDVEDEALALAQMYDAPIHYDPHEFRSAAERLHREHRIQVHEYTFSEKGRKDLFEHLIDQIEKGKVVCSVRNPYWKDLRRQLLGLSVEKMASGSWKITHKGANDDIVVALALAAKALPSQQYMVDTMPMALGHRVSASMIHRSPMRDPQPNAYGEGDDQNSPWGSMGGSIFDDRSSPWHNK